MFRWVLAITLYQHQFQWAHKVTSQKVTQHLFTRSLKTLSKTLRKISKVVLNKWNIYTRCVLEKDSSNSSSKWWGKIPRSVKWWTQVVVQRNWIKIKKSSWLNGSSKTFNLGRSNNRKWKMKSICKRLGNLIKCSNHRYLIRANRCIWNDNKTEWPKVSTLRVYSKD